MAHILVKNLSVNVFGQTVNIVSQVGLLPLFLLSWDTRLYGEWLVLLALPTYFSTIADVGLTNVSANDMAIQFAQGHRDKVLEVFQSAWLFVTILSSLVVTAILVAAITFGLTRALQLSIISGEESTDVLICALGIFFVSFQYEMVQAGLRAVGRFAEGNLGSYLIGLTEVIAIAAALLLGAKPGILATLMVATRLASLLTSIAMLRYFAPWLHHGLAKVNGAEIRRLLVPSIAILGIPAGNAAMMQGLVVILNHTIGPIGVVLFSTTRTMTRFALQLVSMFSRSSWPEISRLYGAGRADRLGAFLTHGTQLAAVLAIGFAITAISGAPLIFKFWTAGRIEADRLLATILMFAVCAAALRAFSDTLIVATNRHARYSGWFALVCWMGAAASYPASQYFGLIGAAIAVGVTEVVLLAISISVALEQIDQGVTPLVRMFTTLLPLERLLFTRKIN